MIANIGFFFTFIFELILMGVISLFLGYFLRKADNPQTLKSYTLSSISVVAFISIIDQYATENSSEIMTFIIPLAFALMFFVERQKSNKFSFKLTIFLCSSIFIGLGFYISSISFIFIPFIINFFFDGIFDFFEPRFNEQKNDLDNNSSSNYDILENE